MTSKTNGFTLFLAASLVTLGSGLLTACNTMQGAGKDVEAAGNKVQEESCEHNSTSTKDCKPAP